MSSKDIAVVVQSEVQYYAVEPLLQILNEKKYSVDIVINPLTVDNTGFKEISSSTYKLLKAQGYDVKMADDAKKHYKIILTPYADIVETDYKYLIRYQYSPVSAKPNPVYLPESQRKFHAILCQSTYEADILSVYAKTYIVSNLKFINYKNRTKKTTKKTLLYLPTYGDVSSIDELKLALELVKKTYKLVVKIHHGTSHLYDEEYRKKILQNLADEYYEADTPLVDLLSTADVVLSDNSGSIFEAIYSETPVAIYAKGLNERRLNGLDTLQYKLVHEGVIPHTDSSDNLVYTINKALNNDSVKKQRVARKNLFPKVKNPLDSWIKIINMYINDEVNQDYINLHDIYTQKKFSTHEDIRND